MKAKEIISKVFGIKDNRCLDVYFYDKMVEVVKETRKEFIEDVEKELLKLHKRKVQIDDGFHHWKNQYGKNQYSYELKLLKKVFKNETKRT